MSDHNPIPQEDLERMMADPTAANGHRRADGDDAARRENAYQELILSGKSREEAEAILAGEELEGA